MPKATSTELIRTIAEQNNWTITDSKRALYAVREALITHMERGESPAIHEFVKLKCNIKPGQYHRTPVSDEKIWIPPGIHITAKASVGLKQRLYRSMGIRDDGDADEDTDEESDGE